MICPLSVKPYIEPELPLRGVTKKWSQVAEPIGYPPYHSKLQAISSEIPQGRDTAGHPWFILSEDWGEFEDGDFRSKRNALDGSWNAVSIHPVDYFDCHCRG